VDAAVEALVTVDGSGTVVEWNRMAAEAFGHSRDEALGRRFADLVVAPADVSAPARNLRGRIGEAGDLLDGQPVEMSLVGRGASPLHALVRVTPARRPGYFHVSILDVSDQRRSEEATREMVAMLAYLADASELLASSLDVDRTLRRLARLVVPRHADWCTINLLEEDGSIRRVAAEHADPQRAAELARLLDAHPNEPDSDSGVAYTIRTGEAQLFEVVDDALLAETANDPEYLEITAQLQIRSCVIAPLEARGRVLGSISLVYTEQAKTYNAADRALAEDLGRRAGLAIDNARLYEQRDTIARSLQRSLLPPFLPEIPGFDLAARYEPAGAGNDVGGDFYDAFETSTGRWNLVIGDVEGKGPDAAALIGLARHTLRALAIEHTSPAEMLRLLNQALLADHSQLLCTVALCHLEVEAGRVIVARAGHPAPMLVRRFGAVEMLGKEGTLLGATDTPVIHETAAQVQPGDNVVLFTDGVVGSRALTAEDVADVLSELAGKGAREIADELVMVAERSRPGGPGDDVAILVARRDQD
jgi:PAS domain S-box-containing protein